jgi:hypothetical protein
MNTGRTPSEPHSGQLKPSFNQSGQSSVSRGNSATRSE